MKAYKGFNKDMTCRGFQFEEGKTYETDKAELCRSGFHACENPLDCFGYYAPGSSVYHEVELDGVSDQREEDTKVCAKKITIGAKLDVAKVCSLHFDYVKSHTTHEVKANDKGSASAGEQGSASAGWKGSASAGNYGSASAGERGRCVSGGSASVGQEGCAVAKGNGCKVKGGIGSLLVIAEENNTDYAISAWKAVVVDGETIKADTWYKLENGEFVEVAEA